MDLFQKPSWDRREETNNRFQVRCMTAPDWMYSHTLFDCYNRGFKRQIPDLANDAVVKVCEVALNLSMHWQGILADIHRTVYRKSKMTCVRFESVITATWCALDQTWTTAWFPHLAISVLSTLLAERPYNVHLKWQRSIYHLISILEPSAETGIGTAKAPRNLF